MKKVKQETKFGPSEIWAKKVKTSNFHPTDESPQAAEGVLNVKPDEAGQAGKKVGLNPQHFFVIKLITLMDKYILL